MGKNKPDKGPAPDAEAKVHAAPPTDAAAPAGTGEAKPKKKKKVESSEGTGKAKVRGRPMRKLSKRYRSMSEKVVKDQKYPIPDAVKLLKVVTKGTKFDQTVNVVLHLGIDPKIAEQMIRGAVSLPKGIGKTKKVIAFC
jgi:hypothetical protein